MAPTGAGSCLKKSHLSPAGFIRKVYLILMLQLLVTVGIICAFLYW